MSSWIIYAIQTIVSLIGIICCIIVFYYRHEIKNINKTSEDNNKELKDTIENLYQKIDTISRDNRESVSRIYEKIDNKIQQMDNRIWQTNEKINEIYRQGCRE